MVFLPQVSPLEPCAHLSALDIIVLNGTKPLRSCLSLMLKRALVSCETKFNTALQEPASLTNYVYNFPPQKNEINKALVLCKHEDVFICSTIISLVFIF